jgi:hypothetical protein
LYYSDLFVDEMRIGKDVNAQNDFPILAINTSEKRFGCLASNFPMDLHFIGDNQCLLLYRYIPRPDGSSSAPEPGESATRVGMDVGQGITGDPSGLHTPGLERVENITGWAFGQFKKRMARVRADGRPPPR